jgi:dolichyl-phosphate beta-glucosyltransferase
MPELSVVIPAYNASPDIVKTLTRNFAYLTKKNISSEIIVSNDGSTDQTKADVLEFMAIHKKGAGVPSIRLINSSVNQGKGSAIRRAALTATGDYILMMDADSSMPIEEVEILWPYRTKFDVVIGSRFLNGGRFQTQHFTRFVISKLGNIVFRMLFSLNIKDTQCGFKLFNQSIVNSIFPKTSISRFGFDIEVLVLATQNGYRIKEVPITWTESPHSSIHVTTSSWQTFWELLKIKRRITKK